MSELIHATARAIAILADRGEGDRAKAAPAEQRACDGGFVTYQRPVLYAAGAYELLDHGALSADAISLGAGIPTCPRCRELFNEALDGNMERDRQLDAALAGLSQAMREAP